MSADRASRGVGDASTELEGAKSQLQFSGGHTGAGGTHAFEKAEHHRVSSAGDQGVDPRGATDAGGGDA